MRKADAAPIQCEGSWSPLAVLGVGLLAILAAVAMVLALSALAQAPDVTVDKTASSYSVIVGDVVTYTINITNTGPASAAVVMTDVMPFGANYVLGSVTGGATYNPGPPERITWSGTVNPGQTVIITFQVLVVEPGTSGPLPIINEACANDGTGEVCDLVTIYSIRPSLKVYLPIVTKNYVPPQPWPWSIP